MEVTNKPSQPNYEYRVGLFSVIALIIVFWGWSWLKDISLRPPQRFDVKFHDIAGLTKNAPVQVNGVRVGTVEKIELRGAGQVLCSLRIPAENTIIPQGSLITIQTLGLVGAKYIEITLPKQGPDEAMPPPILGLVPVTRATLFFSIVISPANGDRAAVRFRPAARSGRSSTS